MTEGLDEFGPIDWLLVEFDGALTGAALPPLLDLVDRGLIRILDVLLIRKAADGAFVAIEFSDGDSDGVTGFDELVGAQSGLLGEEDVAAAAEALENDTRGVLLLYENVWAAPFASALRGAGGQLVASGRIPVQDIIDALDELDAVAS